MKSMFKSNKNDIDIDVMNISENQTISRQVSDISSFLD